MAKEGNIAVVKRFFGDDGYPAVTTDELKELKKEGIAELADQVREFEANAS